MRQEFVRIDSLNLNYTKSNDLFSLLPQGNANRGSLRVFRKFTEEPEDQETGDAMSDEQLMQMMSVEIESDSNISRVARKVASINKKKKNGWSSEDDFLQKFEKKHLAER